MTHDAAEARKKPPGIPEGLTCQMVRLARFEPATHGLEGLPNAFLLFFLFLASAETLENRHFDNHVFRVFHRFLPVMID